MRAEMLRCRMVGKQTPSMSFQQSVKINKSCNRFGDIEHVYSRKSICTNASLDWMKMHVGVSIIKESRWERECDEILSKHCKIGWLMGQIFLAFLHLWLFSWEVGQILEQKSSSFHWEFSIFFSFFINNSGPASDQNSSYTLNCISSIYIFQETSNDRSNQNQ